MAHIYLGHTYLGHTSEKETCIYKKAWKMKTLVGKIGSLPLDCRFPTRHIGSLLIMVPWCIRDLDILIIISPHQFFGNPFSAQ